MALKKQPPAAHLAVSPELEAQYLKHKHLGLLDGHEGQMPFMSGGRRHPKDISGEDDTLWAQMIEEENNIIDYKGGHGVPLSSECFDVSATHRGTDGQTT